MELMPEGMLRYFFRHLVPTSSCRTTCLGIFERNLSVFLGPFQGEQSIMRAAGLSQEVRYLDGPRGPQKECRESRFHATVFDVIQPWRLTALCNSRWLGVPNRLSCLDFFGFDIRFHHQKDKRRDYSFVGRKSTRPLSSSINSGVTNLVAILAHRSSSRIIVPPQYFLATRRLAPCIEILLTHSVLLLLISNKYGRPFARLRTPRRLGSFRNGHATHQVIPHCLSLSWI